MKGIAPLVAIVILALVVGGGAVAYNYVSEDNTLMTVKYTPDGAAKDIIPSRFEAVAEEPAETKGASYTIICDKNVYTGYDNVNIFCNITNGKSETTIDELYLNFYGTKDVGMIGISSWKDKIEKTRTTQQCDYIYGEVLVINNETGDKTYEKQVVDANCYDVEEVYYEDGFVEYTENITNEKVSGMMFAPYETKILNMNIKIPTGSQGKFDVKIGDTSLDPWWSATYPYRYKINENKTYELEASMNDTYGISGHIYWARTFNDSYAYFTGAAFAGDVAIANQTDQKYWENESSGLGNSPTSVWDSSAVAVWHYGEAVGATSMDSTSNNNDAANDTTATHRSTGVFGYDYEFNNANTYVGYPDSASLSPTDELVITGWINPDTIGAEDYIVSKDYFPVSTQRSYYVELNSGGNILRFLVNDGAATSMYVDSSTPVALNSWTHFIVTYDGGASPKMQIWLNGTNRTGTVTNSISAIKDSTISLRIGADQTPAAPASLFDGDIDEIRIYNDADKFTPTVIRDMYYNGYPYRNLTEIATSGETSETSNITVSSNNYSSPVREKTIAQFNISVSNMTITTWTQADITAVLSWNGTEYSPYYETNSTPANWTFRANLTVPLVVTNATNINHFWNFTLDFNNGTIVYNQTTQDYGYTQDIYYSYFLSTPTFNQTSYTMGSPMGIQSALTDAGGVTLYLPRIYINGTAYIPTYSAPYYYYNTTAPTVTGDATITSWANMYVTDGTGTMNRSSGVTTATVSGINITNCTNGTELFRFDLFNEEGFGELLGNLDATFKVYSDYPDSYSLFNISYAGNHTHRVCIYPNTTATAVIDGDIKYYNSTDYYPERWYFIRNYDVSNTSELINLYMLNTTYASSIQFQVTNQNGFAEEDVVLMFQRYYEGLGSYKTVTMALTDTNGYSSARLRAYDAYHKIIALKNGTVVKTFSPMIISSDSNVIIIPAEIVGDYMKYHGDIAYSCTNNSVLFTISCTAVVTDGTEHTFVLKAWEMKSVSQDIECEETDTSSSVTLVCSLGDWTDKTFKYVFYADYPENDDILVSDYINGVIEGDFGIYGLFFMVLLIVGLTFSGLYNPAVALSMTVIAFITGLALGMITISIGAAVSVILILMIAIYKVRS